METTVKTAGPATPQGAPKPSKTSAWVCQHWNSILATERVSPCRGCVCVCPPRQACDTRRAVLDQPT